MLSACPSAATLQAFAQGRLPTGEREALANHVRDCAACQAAFLPLALRSSQLTQTHSDSPLARHRRTSQDDVPASLATPIHEGGLEDTHVSNEGPDPLRRTSLHTGDALNRYVILDRLGAGGMGEVYTAWDPVLDRKVAVKILKGDHDEGSKLGAELKQRLLREAQSLAKLAHPNVVVIHDVGIMAEQVYLAMEFVEGQTLTAWLKAEPRSWQQVLEVFLAAGEGLAAAHDVGITHRDFKPDNVVVSRDGRARVMDFGLAHARATEPDVRPPSATGSGLRRAITNPGVMMGTPAYMSPEAMYGRPTDFRSDQFSFCVALFEALYGHRPFEGGSPGAIAAEIEAGRVKAPPRDTKVPRRIHELVLKGLRRQPEERFQTLRALLVQLGRRKGSRRRTRAVVALVTVAMGSVGVSAWLVRRDHVRCAGVATRLEGVWDPKSKLLIQQAFLATGKPWATAAWHDVEHRLEQYATRWVALRRGACEAEGTRANDEALGQNLVCLSRRLADLEAVSALFTHADGDVVERAVATASALPPLDACVTSAGTKTLRPERAELRSALSAVKARIDAGRYAEALSLARALSAKAASQDERAALAEARIDEAVALTRTGDPRAADAVLEDAILTATQVADDELVARAWVERVGAAALAGLPEAERVARYADAAVARLEAPGELAASLANNRGVLAWATGHFEEAIAAHTRALDLRVKSLGERNVQVARSHSNLGTAWRALGRFDRAVAEYELALGIEETVLDPTHPAVAETLNNLGNALQDRGDLKGARVQLEKALAIKEKAFGPESLTVAITLTNLGALLIHAGDLVAADEALQRAAATKEKLSAGAASLAVTLTNLAKLRREQHRWAESRALDLRAIALRKSGRPADSAYNLTGLGLAALGLGDVSGARAELEEALGLRPTASPERSETQLALARALTTGKGQDVARARGLLQAVIDEKETDAALRTTAQALLAGLK